MQQHTWRLGSGEHVYDREPSHIHVGVTADLLAEAMSKVFAEPGEKKVKRTIDFGRFIGVSNCVRTSESDEIIFAERVHRGGLTRFAKNRTPEPTSLLTVSMRLQPDGRYELGTAYIGSPGHTEYWAAENADEYEGAKKFWNANALCWGYEPVVPGTETTERPW